MNRWWANADQARTILDRVDDSDVVQGVGTAVLGYHALATGVLRPLSEQTLVDVTSIRRALDGIDLEPVAKALGAATRPVMGDAADRYGELLAENLHQQAVDATSRFVTALTNTGVDWPSAVSRAADIHGVPLDQLGVSGEKLRGPRLAPIAQQDWADRALVGFAARVGNREADGSVSKAMKMRTRDWDEDDVNRDRLGRFAQQSESRLTVSAQESRKDFEAYRQARARKKAKKQPRLGLRTATESEQAAADRHPAGGKRVATAEAAMEEKLEARLTERLERKVSDRLEKRKLERIKAFLAPPSAPKSGGGGSLMEPIGNEPRRSDGLYPGTRMRVPTERFFSVPDWVAAEIVHSKGFNVGKLVESRSIPMPVAMNAKDFQSFLDDASEHAQREPNALMAPGRNVIIRVVGGEVAFADGVDNHDRGMDAELATGGTYRIVDSEWPEYDDDGFELGATDFTFRPNKASTLQMKKSLSVKLDNGFEFEYNDMDPARESDEYGEEDWEDTPPLPYDAGFRKADDWDESEVNRDRMGRFARETSRGQVIPITSDKAQRIRAYQEAKRRKAQRRAKRAPERLGLRTAEESPRLSALAQERALPVARTEAELEDRLEQRLAQKLEQRIREKALQRALERREQARMGGDKELDIRNLRAVFPDDEQMATMLHIGETGGTYEESMAFAALMDRLGKQTKPGKDAVDVLDKDRPDGLEMVATPVYENEVPTFRSAGEAFDYAARFISDMWEAWDAPGNGMVTPRIAEFMRESDKRGAYPEPKVTQHVSDDGLWVPKVFIPARPENTHSVLVGSDRDFLRVAAGEIPRFVSEDPVPLGVLMASNGFASERVEATHDAMVQVIRMDFMDNVRH